jgi:predicted AAA+ superfamily ATPase
MSTYTSRAIDTELEELMLHLGAIAVDGAKGVGKTATLQRRAKTIYRLDRKAEHAVVAADPDIVTQAPVPVLVDEWQRVPEVWDVVRRAVDDDATPGRFLLTGSAAPDHNPVHSGAGRIVNVRMRPMALFERGLVAPTVSLGQILDGKTTRIGGASPVDLRQYALEIVRSGFPGLRHLHGGARTKAMSAYVEHIVTRDIPEDAGLRIRRPQLLRRWMHAYAAATATTTEYVKIRAATATGSGDPVMARSTSESYRAALEKVFVLDALEGWRPTRNQLKRAAAAPKHHLVDPALAAALLGINDEALLRGDDVTGTPFSRDGDLFGRLFESLVTQAVRVSVQHTDARVYHFREYDGRREIDIIVERPNQKVLALEVKLSATIEHKDVRHLLWLKEALGDDVLDMIVVNTGPHAYRRPDGVAVVPAALIRP